MIAIPMVELRAAIQPVTTSDRDHRPAVIARELANLGFTRLQIVDPEASRGHANVQSVDDILRDSNARVQVEGVSTTGDIEQLLRIGVDQVVLGARAIDDPEWLADVAELYPSSISIATAVRDRRVVRRGWVRTLPVDILDLVEELNVFELRELVVNVRSLDATNRARELALLEDVVERSRFPVLVSGATATADDCRALEHRGIAGAVIEANRLLDGEIDGREIAHEFGG
jgi:phosphoribosylformimino-5-aminoimidazole carboxamide ribotide isomerase